MIGDQLIEWFMEACKPKNNWMVGTEHEKFCLLPFLSRKKDTYL